MALSLSVADSGAVVTHLYGWFVLSVIPRLDFVVGDQFKLLPYSSLVDSSRLGLTSPGGSAARPERLPPSA